VISDGLIGCQTQILYLRRSTDRSKGTNNMNLKVAVPRLYGSRTPVSFGFALPDYTQQDLGRRTLPTDAGEPLRMHGRYGDS